MKKIRLFNNIVCALSLSLISCASMPPQKELQQVAKNWSMTVRASQVMPIYPLEEDIRPGDIYLVTNSIDSEIDSWNRKGFLPLVNRYARIPIVNDTYTVYFKTPNSSETLHSFNRPPKAAFPTYTFSIDRRGALGLAIPLSSVPVALSMSGARNATGSVVFSAATSLGLPDMVIDTLVKEWASTHKKDLKEMAKYTTNPLLFRVVSRVFAISGATVSIAFQKTAGIAVQAGAPPETPELLSASEADFDKRIEQLNKEIALKKNLDDTEPVEIPDDSASETSENPKIALLESELEEVKHLKALSQIQALRRSVERGAMLNQFGGFILPGGSGRITSRTASGISMEETFDKPLVIGYWATEYLVHESGSLISLGAVKNLVDNPELYRERVKLAAEIAQEPTKSGQVFDDSINLNRQEN